MDGGEDEDGSLREHVELAPPVEQPHMQRERCRGCRGVPLGFDWRSSLPWCAIDGSFPGHLPCISPEEQLRSSR
jgi:hypothetical protein